MPGSRKITHALLYWHGGAWANQGQSYDLPPTLICPRCMLMSTQFWMMEHGAIWCVMAATLLVQDDLICLPPRVATGFGNIFPVVLCTRVTNVLTLVDPSSLRTLHIDVSPASSRSVLKWMQPWCYRSAASTLSPCSCFTILPCLAYMTWGLSSLCCTVKPLSTIDTLE